MSMSFSRSRALRAAQAPNPTSTSYDFNSLRITAISYWLPPVDFSRARRSRGSSPSRVNGRSKAGQRPNLRRRNAPRSRRGYSTRQAESVIVQSASLTSDITPSESLEYDAETGRMRHSIGSNAALSMEVTTNWDNDAVKGLHGSSPTPSRLS